MRYRVVALIAEFWQIVREGTWTGAFRYFRFKRSTGNTEIPSRDGTVCGIGVVGAGTYVASTHLPCLRALNEPLASIVSQSGRTAVALAHVYGVGTVHNSIEELLSDKSCESVLIATPHHLHPEHITAALNTDRYVYCEKPVAIDRVGVERLAEAVAKKRCADRVMIGFNRRFAPAVAQLRRESWLVERACPMEMHYRVNFGPRIQNAMSDPNVGGGRIHGAACHYVDILAYLAGSPIVSVNAVAVSRGDCIDENTFVAVMRMGDGSVASLTFTSEGRRDADIKEELILSCDGHVVRIVDYALLCVDGHRERFWRHRYGAMETTRAFLEAKQKGEPVPISLVDGIAATRVTLAIQSSLRRGGEVVSLGTDKIFRQHERNL